MTSSATRRLSRTCASPGRTRRWRHLQPRAGPRRTGAAPAFRPAVTGDPGEDEPYSMILSGQARRNIRENLPLEVAFAAMETIERSIAVNPHRAGKPLNDPFDGSTPHAGGRIASSTVSMRPSTRCRSTRSATAAMLTGPDAPQAPHGHDCPGRPTCLLILRSWLSPASASGPALHHGAVRNHCTRARRTCGRPGVCEFLS